MPTETATKHLPADLPDHFDGVKQETIVLRHLAGLLELVKLDDASRTTIEQSYDNARHVTGLYRNDDMGCLFFDSGLFTPSGKRIYIGLCQRDEDWHLDCTLRRSSDSDEPVGELLLPDDVAPADAPDPLADLNAQLDALASQLEQDFPAEDTAEEEPPAHAPASELHEADAPDSDESAAPASVVSELLSTFDRLENHLAELKDCNTDLVDISTELAELDRTLSVVIDPILESPDVIRQELKPDTPRLTALVEKCDQLIGAMRELGLNPGCMERLRELLRAIDAQVTDTAVEKSDAEAEDKEESPDDFLVLLNDLTAYCSHHAVRDIDPYLLDSLFDMCDDYFNPDDPSPLLKELRFDAALRSDFLTRMEGLSSVLLKKEFDTAPIDRAIALLRSFDAPKESAEESAAPAPVTSKLLWDTLDKLEYHLIELKSPTPYLEDTSSESAELVRALPDFIGQVLDRPDVIQHELETEAVWHRHLIEICGNIIELMRDLGLDPSCMERLLGLLRSIDPQPTDEIVENEGSVTSPDALLHEMDGEIAYADSDTARIDQDTVNRYDDIGSYFTYSSSDAPSFFQIELKNNAALRGEFLTRLDQLDSILFEHGFCSHSIDCAIDLLRSFDTPVEENSDSSTADAELSTSVSTPVENPATPSDTGDKSPEAVETPVETEQNSPKSTPKEPVQPELPAPIVDYSLPPQSLREVHIPGSTRGRIAALLGLGKRGTTLPQEELDALARDYAQGHDDPARLVGSRTGTGFFYFLISRRTPADEPIVLTLAPSNDPEPAADGVTYPWFCKRANKTWPPEQPSADSAEVPENHDDEPETAPAPHRLTDAQMQQIYNTLVPPYRPGETVLLSKIGHQLASHGVRPRVYGYDSMVQMLSDLPELFTITYTDSANGAARIYSVTIQAGTDTSAEASGGVEPNPAADKPPVAMTERLIQFPASQQATLSRLVNGDGLYDAAAEPLTQEQLTEFRSSYAAAAADGKLSFDADYDCYRFPLTLLAQDGSALSATLKRGTKPNSAPWYISFIRKERGQGIRPGDRLLNFAYIGDKQDFLRSLAEHAEPEQWSFSGKENDYTILWNYIRYTFYRIEFENKIVFDEEGLFAAFDTGLLSRRFGDPLYAVFEPNQPGRKSKWKFNCFCSTFQEGTRQERNMAAKLAVKPQMPSYFTNIYDTIFDPDADMQINFEHIFRDNLERFPVQWVHSLCDIWPRTRAIIQQIDGVDAQIFDQNKITDSASTPTLIALHRRRSELFQQLGEAVNDTSDEDMCTLFDNMVYTLRGCIDKTLMRSRRNHQLAEPCFFPTRNVMSMLLPIRLYRSDTPDLALVLERQKSTVYIGRTVITMAMAYKNARLLRRFTSDWLNNAAIRDDELDED